MRSLLLRSLPLPIMLLLLCNLSLSAQDDPFGGSSDNPFGGDLPVAKRPAQVDDKTRILQLESQLRAMKHELNDVEHTNHALKERVNSSEKKINILESRLINKLEMHQVIFEKLLNSDKPDDQELALNHLTSCFDRRGTSFDERSLDVHEPKVLRRLASLVESDHPTIHRLSVRSLSVLVPSTTMELGFQFGPVWEPTSQRDTAEEAEIYTVLREPSDLNFDATPIGEIVEMFQANYGINIQFDKDLDQGMPVTHDSRGLALGDSFAHLLEKYDLAYRVIDDRLLIIKKSDKRLKSLEAYNVRGLLTEQLDLESLIALVLESFDEAAVSIKAIDEHRMAVTASEVDQRAIGKILGSLAKQTKW